MLAPNARSSRRSATRLIKRLATAVGLGYLIGTFPTAGVVARRASGGTVDLHDAGTGNPGAANAMKVLGVKAGMTVMIGDVGKGALACGVGALVAGAPGAHLAGTASVTGHCYPIWTGFRGGGKGVAASVGQCLATFPAYFPIDIAVAAVTASTPKWKQRAFVATLASSVFWVAGGVLWWAKGWRNLWGPKPSALLPLAAATSSAIIAQRFLAAGPPAPDSGPTPASAATASPTTASPARATSRSTGSVTPTSR
jgi:glycerol-3-phosphate acyltransferase PlsY